MIYFFEFFIYLIIGIVAGFLSGLLGVGGGMVVVPSLLVVFHYMGFSPQNMMQTAIGTSLAAMVFTSGASAWAHHKRVNWLLFKELVPGIILGAILGAITAYLLPTRQLQVVFGLFVCLFGTYFLLTAKNKEIEGKIKPHYLIMSLIGLAIGAISSILGIGGGIITVPMLIFCGTSLQKAISTSAATGFLIAIVGAFSFLYLGLERGATESFGYIYIPAFIVIGLTAALLAPLGAKYAYSTPSAVLKRVFGIYQILIGLLMIWL